MSVLDDARTIITLFSEGGVEICTPRSGEGSNQDEKEKSFAMRSVIQPDADILTFISPEAVSDMEAHRRHFEEVRLKMRCLKRFRYMQAAGWAICIPLSILGILKGGIEQLWQLLPYSALAIVPIGLKKLSIALLRNQTRKAINRLCQRVV